MAVNTGFEEETMRMAAIWWTQLRDPEPSMDLLERWSAWIAADPSNAQAFAQLNALGDMAANASTEQRQQLIDEFAPRRVSRQRRPLLAAANALLSGFIGVAALAAVVGESQARVRLRVILDKNMHGADDVDRHAAAYARRGQWALAVIHWRRAIALRPRQPAYYKALGLAQARLGRLHPALQAWRSGRELDPADEEIAAVLDDWTGRTALTVANAEEKR